MEKNFDTNWGYTELKEWNGIRRKMMLWDNTGNPPIEAFVINYVAGIWVTKEQIGYFHAAEIIKE